MQSLESFGEQITAFTEAKCVVKLLDGFNHDCHIFPGNKHENEL